MDFKKYKKLGLVIFAHFFAYSFPVQGIQDSKISGRVVVNNVHYDSLQVNGSLESEGLVVKETLKINGHLKGQHFHNTHVFPSVSLEAAELFLERGVSALGIDTLSPDRPEDGFRVHKSLLSAGKIIIENVANLDNMPSVGGYVMVFPIKIKDGTEAPVRLVGLTEKPRPCVQPLFFLK